MLRKANQKRSLDDLVIQKGEFDWRTLFAPPDSSSSDAPDPDAAQAAEAGGKKQQRMTININALLTKALGDYEDMEDKRAAAIAEQEAFYLEDADEADFEDDTAGGGRGDANAKANAEGGEKKKSRREMIIEGEENVEQPVDVGDGVDEEGHDASGGGGGGEIATIAGDDDDDDEEEEEGGTVVEYMLAVVQRDWEFFKEWRT